jgi:3-(3-hydroxy-phenyl)propionate hydroxylase
MAPPNFAFKLMREATLRLAVVDAKVRSLINPRQSAPIAYVGSPLNAAEQGGWADDLAAPGRPAPEALLQGSHGNFHLTRAFGKDFVCVVFADGALPGAVKELADHGIGVLDIPPEADSLGQARQRYGLPGAQAQGLVLVRPDGYVMGRWHGLDPSALLAEFNKRELAA